MKNQIILTIIFLVAILLLLISNEMAYRRLKLDGEITRKFAHFSATLSSLAFPYLFDSHWYVLILSSFFLVLLFISRKGHQLKSIHDINRFSAGSYLLPLSIYLTFLISSLKENTFLFFYPILVLAICDPLAGIMGMNVQRYNHQVMIMNRNMYKTWLGSLSFFISCLLIGCIAFYLERNAFDARTFAYALIIAFATTVVEMFSRKGSDNLTIPMTVLWLAVLLH